MCLRGFTMKLYWHFVTVFCCCRVVKNLMAILALLPMLCVSENRYYNAQYRIRWKGYSITYPDPLLWLNSNERMTMYINLTCGAHPWVDFINIKH